ncbi:MAG: hypothetical protein HY959_10560 [Ignavibacteriae bacterium]|nr:hypothetical protein [Ignavibacteriota bacterium]
MNNKSNIILILIGTLLSAHLPFVKVFTFFIPHFSFFGHHHHFIDGPSGFTSFVGLILIGLGLYNIYKENKVKSNSETK